MILLTLNCFKAVAVCYNKHNTQISQSTKIQHHAQKNKSYTNTKTMKNILDTMTQTQIQ